MKHKAFLLLAIGSILLLAAPRARAHHAFAAEFDANKPIKLTGTVTRVEWQNPHTWFYVDVKDDSGKTANWGFEMGSPNLLMRNGWNRNSMKIGDVVTVEGFHAKNGNDIGNARVVVLTNTGQKLFAGTSQGETAR
jgi:uncharacterized protein DUF6152